MSSRDRILAAVKSNQHSLTDLPDLDNLFITDTSVNLISKFKEVIEGIGAKVFVVKSKDEIKEELSKTFNFSDSRVISAVEGFEDISESYQVGDNHLLADVDLMILPVHFAVAENGACWVNDELYQERLMPFIAQHLAFVVKKEDVVATMHHAYQIIADKKYDFGAFIAGPSKTADIEQSLVLGAHGPRSLKVFFL